MSISVCIVGVPGCGKSTLLEQHCDDESRDAWLDGSSVIKRLISPATFRDFDAWPASRREDVRRQSIAKLSGLREKCERALLVAGHVTLRNRTSGIVEEILTAEDLAFYDAFVLVDRPAELVHRHVCDDGRRRHGQALDDISEHVLHERIAAHAVFRRTRSPLLHLTSADNPTALRALGDFLSTTMSMP